MTTRTTSQWQMLPALIRLPHFLGLSVAVFFMAFGISLAGPFLSLYGVNRVGMTPLHLGIFLTLNAVGAVLISTRLARWSDTLNSRKPLVLVSLAGGALGYLGLSVLHTYPAVLLTGIVLLGTGAAAFPQLFAFARNQFNGAAGDLPERALTVLRSMFSLAFVVGPGLGAFALAHWDFEGTFRLAATCLILAALPVIGISGRARPAAPTTGTDSTAPVQAARPIHWVAIAFVLYGMSMIMAMSMFPLFITKTLHGTTAQVGFLIGLCALLEIPIMLALVTLRRLPSVEWLVKGAMGLFAVHFALIYVSQGLPLLIATQVIRAVVLAILAGLGMTYFQQLMPGRFSAATTLFANTTNIGGMLSGVVSGGVAQALGYRDVYLVCAALSFTAWVVMQVITRPSRTEAQT